jgi:Fe-S-cluster containining protein
MPAWCVKGKFDDKQRLSVISKIKKAAVYYPDPVKLGETFPDEVYAQYENHRFPCPFLSQTGICMVYDVRPAICRTHMTFSGPEGCSRDDFIGKYEGYYFPQLFTAIQLLSSLVYEDIQHEKNIGNLFLDEFRF